MPIVPISATAAEGGLTALGTAFEQISSWLTSILDVMLGNPIYLLGIGIFVTGAVIGLGHRLIRG